MSTAQQEHRLNQLDKSAERLDELEGDWLKRLGINRDTIKQALEEVHAQREAEEAERREEIHQRLEAEREAAEEEREYARQREAWEAERQQRYQELFGDG